MVATEPSEVQCSGQSMHAGMPASGRLRTPRTAVGSARSSVPTFRTKSSMARLIASTDRTRDQPGRSNEKLSPPDLLQELPDSDTRHSSPCLRTSAKTPEFIDRIFQVLNLATKYVCSSLSVTASRSFNPLERSRDAERFAGPRDDRRRCPPSAACRRDRVNKISLDLTREISFSE